MRYAIVLMVACALSLAGCRAMQVAEQEKKIAAQMEGLVGKSKEDVVLAIGAPESIETIESIEIFHYRKNVSTRSRAAASGYQGYYGSSSAGAGASSSSTWEQCDTINAYFKDGKMVKWDSHVQR